jgi:hypothetical protein
MVSYILNSEIGKPLATDRLMGRHSVITSPRTYAAECPAGQTIELNRLNEWLYRKRALARQDGDRTERRERKQEGTARRESEQPALFSF